jgi:homoserine O-acetyltransferase
MVVEKKYLKLKESFTTENGFVLKNPVAAYEEYGKADGRVVAICHGGLSSPHAAGTYKGESTPGWWDKLIGPGKVIDTDIFRVICVNSLGGMFGSTSPASINPDTGKKYAAGFPDMTLVDQARFLYKALIELGVKKVAWAVGVSMGSMNAAQLAVLYPDFVEAVTPIATAAYMPSGGMAYHNAIANGIRFNPEYNGGDYDDRPGMISAIQVIAEFNRIYYTHASLYEDMTKDIAPEDQAAKDKIIDNYLTAGTIEYSKSEDPNSVMKTVKAVNTFNLARGFANLDDALARMNMPTLIINVDTDQMFPPKYGKEFADGINKKHPGMAEQHTITSIYGHLGCVTEFGQMGNLLTDFRAKYIKE